MEKIHLSSEVLATIMAIQVMSILFLGALSVVINGKQLENILDFFNVESDVPTKKTQNIYLILQLLIIMETPTILGKNLQELIKFLQLMY